MGAGVSKASNRTTIENDIMNKVDNACHISTTSKNKLVCTGDLLYQVRVLS